MTDVFLERLGYEIKIFNDGMEGFIGRWMVQGAVDYWPITGSRTNAI